MFEEFGKIARLNRDCTVTEKIDGTNAQIFIADDGVMHVGSRSRWITPEADNHGFARWARAHEDELRGLGFGRHYGEWWGGGIQRGYGLSKDDKRFWLFNTHQWSDAAIRPTCCGVVPVLYQGPFNTEAIMAQIERLRTLGSIAASGFMKPEGIVVYHTHAGQYFKVTIERDELPKSLANNAAA